MIKNCSKYSSITKCIECEQGYRIDGSNCKKVDTVEKCSKYNTTSTSTKCIKCSSTHYLSSDKKCTERTKTSIENCSDLHVSKDSCGVCNSNYVGKGSVSSGYSACLKAITNCMTHSTSGSTAKCTACKQGYVIEDNQDTCVSGVIENCE